MEINRAKERYCSCCSTVKEKSKFYPSPIATNEYLPYCKECVGKKYRAASQALDSKWGALWCVCMEMGVPLLREKFNLLKAQYDGLDGKGRRPEPFGLYLALLKDGGVQYRGIFDSDMQLSEFVDLGIEQSPEEPTQKDMDAQRKQWDKVWGKDYDDEDCQRLDEYFEDYTQDLFEMDMAMTMRYRDLCRAELKQFKGEGDKDTFNQIKTLMSMLKLDDFKDNKQSETEKFIERMAFTIENTKPAECEDLEKYKDFSGFGKTWDGLMRCLKNLVAGGRDYPQIPREEQ